MIETACTRRIFMAPHHNNRLVLLGFRFPSRPHSDHCIPFVLLFKVNVVSSLQLIRSNTDVTRYVRFKKRRNSQVEKR